MKKQSAKPKSGQRRPRSFAWSITSRPTPAATNQPAPLGCDCGCGSGGCKMERKVGRPVQQRA